MSENGGWAPSEPVPITITGPAYILSVDMLTGRTGVPREIADAIEKQLWAED